MNRLGADGDVGPSRRGFRDALGEARIANRPRVTPDAPYHAEVESCLDDNTVLELVCGTLELGQQGRAQEHLDRV